MARIVRFVTADLAEPYYGVLEGSEVQRISPHPFVPHDRVGEPVPITKVKLLAPVIPTKIVCVGKNYRDHAAEMDTEVPTEPLLFLKPGTAIVGTGDPIRYPVGRSSEVHHEAELAIVIGGLLKNASTDQARGGIYGFTAANDVTARDLQRSDGQWTRAKGFDSFCPLGPAISTDIDPDNVSVKCWVNDELRQDGNTSDMVFDVATLVSYISGVMTLLPGDVILTGTPSGVGPIEVGDTVKVEIEGIGSLTNAVIAG